MKILFICNKLPYPAKEGGPIAMNMFIDGLHEKGHDLKVIAVSSEKYNVNQNSIPQDYLRKTKLESVFVDLRIKFWGALKCFLQNKSYHVQRFISKELCTKIEHTLLEKEYDIVQLETIFMLPYIDTIRKHSKAKIVLRSHNVEHQIWEDIAKDTHNPIKRFYINHLAKTLKIFEQQSLSKTDGIVCITKADVDILKPFAKETPITDISFGLDTDSFKVQENDLNEASLFHLGAMNWIPNVQGIRWFLDEVWPDLHQKFPKLKLHLAGNEMPEDLLKKNLKNVFVKGFIDDPKKYMADKSLMIVPLFSGSGIRIKIIEGMAAGKTIISTTKGAQGIECEHKKNILIADSKQEFIDCISHCIKHPEQAKLIGKNARAFVEQNHNKDELIERLIQFYSQINS